MVFGLIHLSANNNRTNPEGLDTHSLRASSAFGRVKDVSVPRFGDTLGDTVLCVRLRPPVLPSGYRFEWVECIGLRIVKSIKLVIGAPGLTLN